ncbi:MAG: PAS domain S-box protein [Actinomycetia bacterium]|nr:PAS domain S-box protein [Actinomycetes bacterium]
MGLLELRDRRSDFFSSRSMEAWEGLAARLTRGLARHTLAQRLRRTERRYYSVLDGVGDPLVVSLVGGKILEVNAAACEILGYSRDELLSFAVVDICSREGARRVSQAWDELKGSGQVVYEIDLLAKDGRRLPVETVSRMVDWEGDTAVLSISRDLAERRRLTEQAIESERRLRKLFEQSSDLVDVVNSEGVFVFQSPSSAVVLGYEDGGMLGRSAFDLMHPDDVGRMTERYRTFVAGTPVCAEPVQVRIMARDGSYRVFEARERKVEGTDGQVYLVINSRDVTEQVHLHERLAQSEAYYRDMVNGSWDLITVVGKDLVCNFQNAASRIILGYAPEELIGRDLSELIHPEDVDQSRERFSRFALSSRERSSPVETRFRHKDGSWRVLEVRVHKSQDPRGGVSFIVNATDVTERKRMEDWLRLAELSVERAADFIHWVDAHGRIIFANESACRRDGYSREELLQLNIVDLSPDVTPELWASYWKELKASGSLTVASVHRTKSGEDYPVEVSVNYLVQGGEEYSIGFSRDITERVAAERKLRESQTHLSILVDGVVHALGSLAERRDPYTAGHQQRVADLSYAMGKEMGLEDDRLRGLRIAALLHDIGKVGVPIEILSKPGAISEAEMEIVRWHPEVGYEILKDIDFGGPVAETVRQHHERLDGSGYPSGIYGEEILLEARIIAVADVVEAMSSHRPNRASLGLQKALAEIQTGKGMLYDSRCVDACLKVVTQGLFPSADNGT